MFNGQIDIEQARTMSQHSRIADDGNIRVKIMLSQQYADIRADTGGFARGDRNARDGQTQNSTN